jgi:hypothetical protein
MEVLLTPLPEALVFYACYLMIVLTFFSTYWLLILVMEEYTFTTHTHARTYHTYISRRTILSLGPSDLMG